MKPLSIQWLNIIKLPIPKVYEVIEFMGRMPIVMDLLEGTSLDEIIHHDKGHMNSLIDAIVDLQIKIHSADAVDFPKMKDRLTHRITDALLLNSQQKERLIVLLNGFQFGNHLCHGDYHFQNLIMVNEKLMVIDWVDATSGSPAADVCRTYMFYFIYESKDFADIYLNTYCEKTAKKSADVLQWLPIIAGARLSVKNEAETDQLLEWVEKATAVEAAP